MAVKEWWRSRLCEQYTTGASKSTASTRRSAPEPGSLVPTQSVGTRDPGSGAERRVLAVDFEAPVVYCSHNRLLHHSFTAMVKIVALFRKPSDVDLFNDHYWKVHLPLARKTPGLRKLELTRLTAAPIGDASFFLMAEMYYDSMEALNA